MINFKTFSRPQQFFIAFFMLSTFATLISFRHFSVAVLWGSGVVLTGFQLKNKDFFKQLCNTLKHPAFLMLGLLLIWSFLTSFWSLKPIESFKGSFSQSATLVLIAVLFTHLRSWNEKNFTFLMKLLALLVVISALVLFPQTLKLGTIKTLLGGEHATLKTNVTLLFTLAIPVIAYFYLTYKKKFLPLIILSFLLVLCHKTSYQAGFFGIILGLLGASLTYNFSRFIPMVAAYSSAFLCLTLPFIYHHVIPLLDLKYLWYTYNIKPFIHRLYIWEFITKNIWEKPFLGWGATASKGFPTNGLTFFDRNDIFPSHPHNHIMQIWLEMGGIGVILLAVIHFMTFRAIAKIQDRTATAFAMFFSIVSFTILSLSHSIWHKWWITWFGAMTVLLIVVLKRTENAITLHKKNEV